jgi:hypothetical protein
MRIAAVIIVGLVFSTSAVAFQPRTGQWWNPAESGSGYNVDIQNGVLVVTIFSYKANGDSEWYLASGALTNGGHTFTATLDKYRNGQCISCTYHGRPSLLGNDGSISINFISETSAILLLPSGRGTAIVPYNFGFGSPPTGLYGEWIFVYDIGSGTFAERFNFSTTIPSVAASNGNGIAWDLARNAGCELQVVGPIVGTVVCVDLDSAFVIQNQYTFSFGLDETYDGVYTFPPTGDRFTMKGFRIRGSSLAAKDVVTDDGRRVTMIAKSALAGAGATVPSDSATQLAFTNIANALRAAAQ